MKKMSGNIKFSDLFDKQKNFQTCLLYNKFNGTKVGEDIEWFKYHCLAMVEEMGEVMKSDKRWKTHRNERFVPDEKLDEIADVFITAMNIAMFSGFSAEDVSNAIFTKINKNTERLENVR